MAKITPESIAGLKALFKDNEKALGSNFSQLIDFFNNNKVTDNGDGTFTVGAITVDASKLYDLINNSSPNILPLDNEFTGKNTFDIAPINKANGKPYITADSVPQVDLSNYPTKDQLATKADTSAIDPSVMVKRVLTADDDVLALGVGTYYVWGKTPKNYPTNVVSWGRVIVKMLEPDGINSGTKLVEVFDTSNNHWINLHAGYPLVWSGWEVPNATIMATKSDVTTAISTATANMVDSTKATNFTAGLQSGGVDVATAADLKSIEASAWRQLDNKYITPASGSTLAPSTNILYKIDDSIHTLYLSGSIALTTNDTFQVTVQLGSIIKSILTLSVPYIGYDGVNPNWNVRYANNNNSTNLTLFTLRGILGIASSLGTNGSLAYVTYDELV